MADLEQQMHNAAKAQWGAMRRSILALHATSRKNFIGLTDQDIFELRAHVETMTKAMHELNAYRNALHMIVEASMRLAP